MALRQRKARKDGKATNASPSLSAHARNRKDYIEVVDDFGSQIAVYPEELTVLESFLSQAIHEILGDVVHKQASKLKRD